MPDDDDTWRCGCLVCFDPDRCPSEAMVTAISEEVSLELCRACFDDHAARALQVAEAAA